MSKSKPKTILITSGEPAGCGPDIIVHLAQHTLEHPVVVLADPEVLAERAKQLSLSLTIEEITDINNASILKAKHLQVFPVKVKSPVKAGQLNILNAAYVLETLDLAIQLCLQHALTLITAPIHKAIINDAGIPFLGHTQYLAEKTQSKNVLMFFMSDKLCLALVTDHLPLREVASHITRERLRAVIDILYQKFHQPRLLICGLNPHAGENGYLGKEEQEIISPVLEEYRQRGYLLTGPVAADTAFTQKQLAGIDIVVTMYHDQALPVLKQQSFGHAANITLGLPFLRTSVDHGIALALAGTGKVDYSSLKYVYHKTIEMIHASGT